MKKTLLACLSVSVMMALSVQAATPTECAYTPLQNLIRNVRDVNEINTLLTQGVVFDDVTVRCGGSLMQLAILRGNAEVFRALLEQDMKRAAQKVSLEGFAIPGAPKQVPLLLFAAYYAPNEPIMNLMIQAVTGIGGTLNQVDDYGRNVLWYLDKNPVLRNTALSDSLTQSMLTSLVPTKNGTLGNGTGLNLGQKQEIKIQGLEAAQPISVPQVNPAKSNSIVEVVDKVSVNSNIVEPTMKL